MERRGERECIFWDFGILGYRVEGMRLMNSEPGA
jgi:hypothetical protein